MSPFREELAATTPTSVRLYGDDARRTWRLEGEDDPSRSDPTYGGERWRPLIVIEITGPMAERVRAACGPIGGGG